MKWVSALVRTEKELYTNIRIKEGINNSYSATFSVNRDMRNNCGKYIDVFQVASPPPWCREYITRSEKKDWYKDKVGFYWHVSAFKELDGQDCGNIEDWINKLFPPDFLTIMDDEPILEEDY